MTARCSVLPVIALPLYRRTIGAAASVATKVMPSSAAVISVNIRWS